MTAGLERHHQPAKDLTPPLQDSGIEGVIDDLKAKVAQTETQLGQYQNITDDLRKENQEIFDRYKPLQQFEDLLEISSKYTEVLLKDPIMVGKLAARCKEMYGTVSEHLITVVVQECLRQGLLTRWHITKQELERQRG